MHNHEPRSFFTHPPPIFLYILILNLFSFSFWLLLFCCLFVVVVVVVVVFWGVLISFRQRCRSDLNAILNVYRGFFFFLGGGGGIRKGMKGLKML